MTKFINRIADKPIKPTTFKFLLDCEYSKQEATEQPSGFTNVEFIGHDRQYGDVFKAWDHDPQQFTLYFGIKGDEVYVNK